MQPRNPLLIRTTLQKITQSTKSTAENTQMPIHTCMLNSEHLASPADEQGQHQMSREQGPTNPVSALRIPQPVAQSCTASPAQKIPDPKGPQIFLRRAGACTMSCGTPSITPTHAHQPNWPQPGRTLPAHIGRKRHRGGTAQRGPHGREKTGNPRP